MKTQRKAMPVGIEDFKELVTRGSRSFHRDFGRFSEYDGILGLRQEGYHHARIFRHY